MFRRNLYRVRFKIKQIEIELGTSRSMTLEMLLISKLTVHIWYIFRIDWLCCWGRTNER